MNDVKRLSHTKWDCKCHVTWIPKYRKKEIYGDLRLHLGEVFRELACRVDCEILEGHLLPDHSHIARTYFGRRRNFTGQHFWTKGFYVSTVGRDEEVIRQYIKEQEAKDRRLDQLNLFK